MRLCANEHNEVEFDDDIQCPVCEMRLVFEEHIAGLVADKHEKVQIIALLEERLDAFIADDVRRNFKT